MPRLGNDTQLYGFPRRFVSRGDLQLGENCRDVVTNRSLRQKQRFGDVLGALPLDQQCQHFQFPARQLEGVGLGGCSRSPRNPLDAQFA